MSEKIPPCPVGPQKQIAKRPARKVYKHRFDQHAPIIGDQVKREICRRIARGESIAKIESTDNMPSKREIYELIWRDPEFLSMYKKARITRCEVMAEELRDMAAQAAKLDSVAEKKSMAHVQAVRLQVDTEKWLLSKLIPGEYGDELPNKGGDKALSGVLEIIKAIAGLAKTEKPVKGAVIDVPVIEDTK